MVNKTNSGRILSSLYKASACNQSHHLPTHHPLPASPTSFNPINSSTHLSVHPQPSNRFILPVAWPLSSTHCSLFGSPSFFLFVFMRKPSELLLYLELLHIQPAPHSHTWELPSITTVVYCWLRWSCRGLRAVLKGTLSPLVVDEGMSYTHFYQTTYIL